MDQENEIRQLKSFVSELMDFIENPDRTDQRWKDSVIKMVRKSGYGYDLNVTKKERATEILNMVTPLVR